MTRVGVTSKSFSKNAFLRNQLLKRYPDSYFNENDVVFDDETLVDFLKGCDKAIIGLETINKHILTLLPDLRVISKYGVGLDSLDLAAMSTHRVMLGWTPGVNKRSVSELVVGQMIAVLRYLYETNGDLKKGIWQVRKSHQLSCQTVGIIGLGNVGQDLVRLLRGFGCSIVAFDVADRSIFARKNNVQLVDFCELIQISDIISVHVPYKKNTANMIGKLELSKMKDNSILLNFARGRIIDEAAALGALQKGKLSALVLDVFEEEPPRNRDLIEHPRFFGSCHIGGSSFEAINSMGLAAIDGLDAGRPALDFSQF